MERIDTLYQPVLNQELLDAAYRRARVERSKAFYRIAEWIGQAARNAFETVVVRPAWFLQPLGRKPVKARTRATGTQAAEFANPSAISRRSDLHLRHGDVYRFEPAPGSQLTSVNGTLWITQDQGDIVIEAGHEFTFDKSASALVTPLMGDADARIVDRPEYLAVAA